MARRECLGAKVHFGVELIVNRPAQTRIAVSGALDF
jgi:hypothetical protein